MQKYVTLLFLLLTQLVVGIAPSAVAGQGRFDTADHVAVGELRALDSSLARQLERVTGTVTPRPKSTSPTTADSTQGAPAPPDWDTVMWSHFDLCGDGIVDSDAEQCDRSDLFGASCTTLGFTAGGTLLCDNSCHFFTAYCSNVITCTIASCTVDSDCGTGCGPCVQVGGETGYCAGSTGGGID